MGHANEQSDGDDSAASELLHAAFDDADLSPADAQRGEPATLNAAPEAGLKLRAKLRWLELHSPRLLRLAGLDADGLPVSLEQHSQPALRALFARVAAATGAYFPH